MEPGAISQPGSDFGQCPHTQNRAAGKAGDSLMGRRGWPMMRPAGAGTERLTVGVGDVSG